MPSNIMPSNDVAVAGYEVLSGSATPAVAGDLTVDMPPVTAVPEIETAHNASFYIAYWEHILKVKFGSKYSIVRFVGDESYTIYSGRVSMGGRVLTRGIQVAHFPDIAKIVKFHYFIFRLGGDTFEGYRRLLLDGTYSVEALIRQETPPPEANVDRRHHLQDTGGCRCTVM